MKKLIYTIIILIYLLTVKIFAEDCGETITGCTQFYPYKYCKDGKFIRCCVRNPILDRCNGYNDYQPLKIDLPICFEFEDSGPDMVEFKRCNSSECWWAEIYRKEYIQGDIDEANYEWNCICNKQSETCSCKVKILFSSDPTDFEDPDVYCSNNNLLSNLKNKGTCNIDCEGLKVVLNNCDQFTHLSVGSQAVNFFVNEKYYKDDPNYRVKGHQIDLLDILLFELGRCAGLSTYTDNNSLNWCYIPGNEVPHSGIMQITKNDRTFLNYYNSQGLTKDDKCMFKRLYCPDLVNIIKDETFSNNKIGCDIIPNPSDEKFKIYFYVKSNTEIIDIKIYNLIGESITIINQDIYSKGNHFVTFDCRDLLSGNYYCVIKVGVEYYQKKLLIVR